MIIHGDNIEVLREMADNSIDAIVTDSPYGLGKEPDAMEVLRDWLDHGYHEIKAKGGFMGRSWDAFVPQPAFWVEAIRVLKPGGHVVSFFGTRTYDWGVMAMRLAGFEIRDRIQWAFDESDLKEGFIESLDHEQRLILGAILQNGANEIFWSYGSGFPKALDVGKAVDKLDATEERKRRNLSFTKWMRSTGLSSSQIDKITDTNMGGHYLTQASQPAICTREHFEKLRPHITIPVPNWVENLIDERTVESENFKNREVVEERTMINGGGNALQMRMGDRVEVEANITAPATPEAQKWDGWKSSIAPANEPIVLARKPLDGTIAENVLKWSTGALNVDGSRIPHKGEKLDGGRISTKTEGWDRPWKHDPEAIERCKERGKEAVAKAEKLGRFPKNFLHDGSPEVLRVFDKAGETKSGGNDSGHNISGKSIFGNEKRRSEYNRDRNQGSAARYFQALPFTEADRFMYCPKAQSGERDGGVNSSDLLLQSIEIETDRGVFNLKNLYIVNKKEWEKQDQKTQSEKNGEASQKRDTFVFTVQPETALFSSMFMFGRKTTALFPKAIKFTTLTGLRRTIELKTLSFYQPLSTKEGIQDAIKTGMVDGSSHAENAAITNILTPIFTKDPTAFLLGVKGAALKMPLLTSVSEKLGVSNFHSTVKPVSLMLWLCRLITPPGGIILDPFVGSGTTAVAAKLGGFECIGIEQDADSAKIAQDREKNWRKFGDKPKKKAKTDKGGQRSLFD